MKRIISLLIFAASCIATFAASPKLQTEQLFDGRYNDNDDVMITIVEKRNDSYRCITVENNSNLVKQFIAAFEKDRQVADEYTYNRYDPSNIMRYLKFENNGESINIGLQTNKAETYGRLFIQIKK